MQSTLDLPPSTETNRLILPIDRTVDFDPTIFSNPFSKSGMATIWRGPSDGKGLEGKEEEDSRSLMYETVDFTLFALPINFPTGLNHKEPYITGELRRSRLLKTHILADVKVGLDLVCEEEQKILRLLYDEYGIKDLEILGTTLRSFRGRRCALRLSRRLCDDGSWFAHYTWLGYKRTASSCALAIKRVGHQWGAPRPL